MENCKKTTNEYLTTMNIFKQLLMCGGNITIKLIVSDYLREKIFWFQTI